MFGIYKGENGKMKKEVIDAMLRDLMDLYIENYNEKRKEEIKQLIVWLRNNKETLNSKKRKRK